VRLPVGLVATRSGGGDRQAVVVDISLAGAGLETEDALIPGERVTVSFTAPTLWDPLVLGAVVAWSVPPQPRPGFPIGRNRPVARAGIAFDYAAPEVVLAMFEMLTTLGYE
jgi:hypothetical protein